VQYTDKDEVAVCNLCSINLSKFVDDNYEFNYDRLVEITEILVKNMNRVIDNNYYPVKEAKFSNMRHRYYV
jgi:ribonucleotide reductase alpha subunit